MKKLINMKELKTIYVCVTLEENNEYTKIDKLCVDPLEAINFIEAKMHEHVMEGLKQGQEDERSVDAVVGVGDERQTVN